MTNGELARQLRWYAKQFRSLAAHDPYGPPRPRDMLLNGLQLWITEAVRHDAQRASEALRAQSQERA